MFYWLMKNLVVGPIILTAFRPWVRGLENVPKDGAVILASNHLSFVDSVFLPLVLDRRVVFLAKSDYFTGKGLRSCRSTARAAKPPRPRSTRACACSPTVSPSASTRKAREARTASCTGAERGSRA